MNKIITTIIIHETSQTVMTSYLLQSVVLEFYKMSKCFVAL